MQLIFYRKQYKGLIEQYHLKEEQLRFTLSPSESIELADKDAERFPVLAIEEDKLVTFFVLHINEGVKPYSASPNAILLRSFSTDSHYLGKGYAKKALMLLPVFVKKHFSPINEIVLAVNVENKIAQELYKTCGFIDEGVRKMGIKGELIIMSKHL